MPRYKCLACRTRFYSAAKAADLFSGDVCPQCGSLTEPIDDLARFGPRSSPADRFGHLIARREVVRAQVRLEAERWGDEGGSIGTLVEGGAAVDR